MKYQIAPATNGQSLSGIFRINRTGSTDEISIDTTRIGSIAESESDGLLEYQFTPHLALNEFPWRSTYESVWLDILIHLANSSDLAIEFTIAVTNKVRESHKPLTADSLATAYSDELF